MAAVTGDIAGQAALLQRDLKHINYPSTLSDSRLAAGNHRDLIGILQYTLQEYSPHVAHIASEYVLEVTRHSKFLDGAFKMARNKFNLRILLTVSQFMSESYVERKLMLVHQIIAACREYHSMAARQHRLSSLKVSTAERRKTRAATSTGVVQPQKHSQQQQPSTVLDQHATSTTRTNCCSPNPADTAVQNKVHQNTIPVNPQQHHHSAAVHANIVDDVDIPLRQLLAWSQPQQHDQTYNGNPCFDEYAICANAQQQQLWNELPGRIAKAEDEIANLRQMLNIMQTDTKAHLAVLETRVSTIERKPHIRPVNPQLMASFLYPNELHLNSNVSANEPQSSTINTATEVVLPAVVERGSAVSEDAQQPDAAATSATPSPAITTRTTDSSLQGGHVMYPATASSKENSPSQVLVSPFRKHQVHVRWQQNANNTTQHDFSAVACYNPLFRPYNTVTVSPLCTAANTNVFEEESRELTGCVITSAAANENFNPHRQLQYNYSYAVNQNTTGTMKLNNNNNPRSVTAARLQDEPLGDYFEGLNSPRKKEGTASGSAHSTTAKHIDNGGSSGSRLVLLNMNRNCEAAEALLQAVQAARVSSCC